MTGSMTFSSKLPAAPPKRDRRVVADDLGADLADRLADDRVDLARHDRRARLQVGDRDLGQPGPRPGAHQPQVVADLVQADRDRPQRRRWPRPARRAPPAASKWSRASVSGRSVSAASAGDHRGRESGRGVEPGADRGAAERQLAHVGAGPPRLAATPCRDGRGVAAELLAERDRRGVHQVRPAALDHVGELAGLGLERRRRGGPGAGQQRPSDQPGRGEVDRRREDVVGRLGGVDVVVGMDRPAQARGWPASR